METTQSILLNKWANVSFLEKKKKQDYEVVRFFCFHSAGHTLALEGAPGEEPQCPLECVLIFVMVVDSHTGISDRVREGITEPGHQFPKNRKAYHQGIMQLARRLGETLGRKSSTQNPLAGEFGRWKQMDPAGWLPSRLSALTFPEPFFPLIRSWLGLRVLERPTADSYTLDRFST